ncbi:hypothetical protein BDN72DRAFT_766577 [Pluteus cervinus]|uniref:Uncharacterized protein n=1 Tax=Pluteus cervinus TaxID=181527 RepID=A0ACD3AYJ9_9AGAR|nr:hypothetical protein BDN72DRAFT_766577 [Pluteus cervinus]
MSRGERQNHSGNLSHSMRQNYEEHGVSEYYKQVGATYRNPHFPGVRQCLFSWFTRWWTMESANFGGLTDPQSDEKKVLLFDMACGSGEVTLAFAEWWKLGKQRYLESQEASISHQSPDGEPTKLHIPRRKAQMNMPPPLGSDFPEPLVIAADPFTSTAFTERTSFPCSTQSFSDIAEGTIPSTVINLSSNKSNEDEAPTHIEMVVCSFALHLIDNPSELFSLLWELSTKARWLVILAPHKKPEIKDGWGWTKWNVDSWEACTMSEHKGELLYERVHCRVYRSTAL